MRTALLSLALLAGCAAQQPAATPPIHLSGTSWQRADDDNASPHFPTMTFSDTRATGYDGCNAFFATVAQDGEKLRFNHIGTVTRGCDAGATADAERSFLHALEATRYGHYDDQTLVLLDAGQHQLARLDRTP